jgi:hypothetical protein
MQIVIKEFSKFGAWLVLIMVILTSSCVPDKGKNIPDVSDIAVAIKIHRFEKDLMNIDTNNVFAETNALIEKYPIFMKEIYLPKILPSLQDTNVMAMFVKSPGIRKLYDTCVIVYNDISDIENEFNQAFRFYKHYFPERDIPKVVSFISEYSIGTFTYEQDILGIGWDFFLGADYPNYNPTFFPKYIKRTMNKDHVVSKSIEAIATDLVGEAEGDRLMDLMITNGKILYIMDQLLPYAPDSIKLAYTQPQVEWCEANELAMWSHFLSEDLLYSTRRKDIRKLVDHSPNSPGMPEEAPGRTANWLGWQIVKSFMKRHPDTTLEELIALKDAQQLLDQARYKPRR